MDSTREGNWTDRLFTEHPRSLGMSWAEHGAGAAKIGAELIGAGCAAIVHAAVPGWFTETAGRTVTRIYDHIQQRKQGSDNPNGWPDYEI
jgi:hypothetical protein